MPRIHHGGGLAAIAYTLRKAREAGGVRALWRAMRTRNACKTCAVGMGGQLGGMVNEEGRFPELCKKSVQAMVADMQPGIPNEFWKSTPVGRLRQLSPRQLEHAGRLVSPVLHRRETGRYAPLDWDEALDRIAGALKSVRPNRSFWYFSGRSSNEAGFLLQLLARLYGTNNVNNCSYYCHQASGVGLKSAIGTGTATIKLDDLEKADLLFLIGANPASNHPRLIESFRRLRARGGDIIVINPIREAGLERFRVPSHPGSLLLGSRIATEFVQPHIGGDLALLTALAKATAEAGACDEQYLQSHCEGWPELEQQLQSADIAELCRRAGVETATVQRIARRYAESQHTVFAWAMGITHHAHGVQNVQAIANLALMRGMVGKRGAGLMPIRGHSNVQGMGSMGVTPELAPAIAQALRRRHGLDLPGTPGLDTMACMQAAARGDLRVGIGLGGNLFGSNPDADATAAAFRKLDLMVYLSTTLNTGHAWGTAKETIILPVRARDEEHEATTQESMFNYVRLSDGGPARLAGPRGEIDVIAELAVRVLGSASPVDFLRMRDARLIREEIAAAVPGYERMGALDETREEFQIGGRTLHTPVFRTESGRAALHAHETPATETPAGSFRLMTIRSEGQFNTVVYEEEDLYRGVDRRDVVLMHPDDLRVGGLEEGSQVVVYGPAGALYPIRATAFDRIRPGNVAMYFPEANRLLDQRIDPVSRTPAFKGAVVRIEAMGIVDEGRQGLARKLAG